MNILEQIVEHTRSELPARCRHTSSSDLRDRPLFAEPRREFRAALADDGIAIIAEVKKASPSKGIIRQDFHPQAIALDYERGGAAAISVLTEEAHFLGSLDFLAQIRTESSLPLLRKDFIIDPYQLVEARAFGADAVLLIAAILAPSQLHDLHAAAGELGLDVLVEIYDPRELDRLDVDAFDIIGVNNRDLRSFQVDINRSIQILTMLPGTITRVSESGIESASDLSRLLEHDIDAALIGESFMRATSPGERLKELVQTLHETTR